MKMFFGGNLLDTNNWETVERPGYLGKKRELVYAEWTSRFRFGWKLMWKVNDLYVDFIGVCRLYEDAYFVHMGINRETVDELVAVACNVYDDARSNIKSGFDYTHQETDRTHIQDIAIRNALLRMGRWFEGDELIQIRDKIGKHPLSVALSPGRVPFHRPDWIDDEIDPKWWQRGSVESFYQSNRWLVVQKQPVG